MYFGFLYAVQTVQVFEVRTDFLYTPRRSVIYESPIRHFKVKKYKGPAISPIEAHNERTKEQYASNPDIDTSRSRYNLHLVQPQGRYREEADRMIAAAHCRVRKDSVRVCGGSCHRQPGVFQE